MIIVSGRIYITPGTRDAFLADSAVAMRAARRAPGCRDFVVVGDPLEPDRVNVYEEWDSSVDLLAFRGDGPGPAFTALIVRADVSRHEIAISAPA
jgi:quinol monooxygenase YgiN